MSKELDEFYKEYSTRMTEIDDTPLVKVMDGGKFKLLSIEEYEEMTNKIADIEAKLAESKNEIERLKSKEKKIQIHTKRDWFERCCQLEDESIILGLENEELKQQLAEKENKYQEEAIFIRKCVKNLEEHLLEKEKEIEDMKDHQKDLCLRCGGLTHKQYKKDKIDFVIAELEKVKEKVICGVMDIGNPFWSYFRKDGSQYMTSEDLHNALEQEFTYQIQEQTKKLKEGK